MVDIDYYPMVSLHAEMKRYLLCLKTVAKSAKLSFLFIQNRKKMEPHNCSRKILCIKQEGTLHFFRTNLIVNSQSKNHFLKEGSFVDDWD